LLVLDVTTSIHFEGIASSPEWQLRVMRCQAKSIAKSVWKAEREAALGYNVSVKRSNGLGSDLMLKRKYVRKKDRLAGERAAASDAVPLGGGGTPSLNNDGANGTGLLSTTSTSTPLVANSKLL